MGTETGQDNFEGFEGSVSEQNAEIFSLDEPLPPVASGPDDDGAAGMEHPVADAASVADGSGTETAMPDERSDAELYADALGTGSASYGEMMGRLGWGATRAWQAETALMKAGRLRHDRFGKASLKQ